MKVILISFLFLVASVASAPQSMPDTPTSLGSGQNLLQKAAAYNGALNRAYFDHAAALHKQHSTYTDGLVKSYGDTLAALNRQVAAAANVGSGLPTLPQK
ncbi:hypothetical protein JTE90_012259 [Oedothorax gibbosus]|uniref:Uncharacterized protein n=1 Tax=Oedothorax gibbosus TaxID=931172 RepID=A0AAV6VKK7_9ARAC|nr:hypothetical protein JTE90_012259 [Oedothorax gibbosus]